MLDESAQSALHSNEEQRSLPTRRAPGKRSPLPPANSPRAAGVSAAIPLAAIPAPSPSPAQEVTWADPLGSEVLPWATDLTLPSLFLGASALILGFIDPIYIAFTPQTLLTLLLAGAGAGAMLWGVYRADLRLYFASAAYLFCLLALCLATQPSQLGAPFAAVMPLRVLLFALVLVAWSFLMRPPLWARRALVALVVPTGLLLLLMGGPVLASSTQGVPLLSTNFSPYWLAADSRGTVYAASAEGNSIWVFDPSGLPAGTIWPATARGVGQAGPGIVPAGYPTPFIAPYIAPGSPPPPGYVPPPRGVISYPQITFCGIAVDPDDNLLLVNSSSNQVMTFSARADLLASWAAPDKFEGSKGCIAADANYVYLSTRFGDVYVLDRSGKELRSVKLSYQPFGIAADRRGHVLVTGPFQLDRIEAATGRMESIPLPPNPRQLRIPYQALLVARNGDILATDVAVNRIERMPAEGGETLLTYGDLGSYPGQFQGMGGLAEDAQGRVLLADWQHGVIQRFTADGRLDAVLWAYSPRLPAVTTEEKE